MLSLTYLQKDKKKCRVFFSTIQRQNQEDSLSKQFLCIMPIYEAIKCHKFDPEICKDYHQACAPISFNNPTCQHCFWSKKSEAHTKDVLSLGWGRIENWKRTDKFTQIIVCIVLNYNFT